MEIWVEFDGAKWSFSPDPAVVSRGTPIMWRFRSIALSIPQVLWTVYFTHGSPFRSQGTQFTTTTANFVGQHTGTTGSVTADDPGEYKYGVRAQDVSNQSTLGDDDPRLVVTP
jgi:hypothetical protein